MQGIDYAKMFCYVEALNDAAETAFRLPHNSKYLVSPVPNGNAPKRQRRARQTTPSFHYEANPVLAFTLEAKNFYDPLRGLTFGSDDDNCDIALDSSNVNGVSAVHFRLNWNWQHHPDPNLLSVFNASGNGTRVEGRYLGRDDTFMLQPVGPTIVEAGPVKLRFEVPDPDKRSRAFSSLWKKFVKEARESQQSELKMDRFIIAPRFDPTPPGPGLAQHKAGPPKYGHLAPIREDIKPKKETQSREDVRLMKHSQAVIQSLGCAGPVCLLRN